LLINLLALAQLLADVEYFWFVWLTPALLLACALVRTVARPAPDSPLSAPLAA
jgi:hypothetical protein